MTFRLLPEWEQQEYVLIAWPHANSDWAAWLDQAQATYCDLVAAITSYARAIILVNDAQLQSQVEQQLTQAGIPSNAYELVEIPYHDTWARDFGPLSTVNEHGQITLMDFTFNAWGNKYDATLDNQATRALLQQFSLGNRSLHSVDMVLEGGAVECDNHGTVLTTRSCLLTDTRNPQLNEQQIEAQLQQWLGAKRVLWLDHGQLSGDDTDGHIDTIARFCDDHTIAYQSCNDEHHPDYHELKLMEQQLQSFTDFAGKPYRLIPLPMPTPLYNQDNALLPATYANFLILNNAVLVPIYNVDEDELALAQLQQAFPEKTMVAVNCATLVQQFGSLHCVTMQLPRVPSK